MPTYEYACRDCGGRLEVVQSFHDAALTECEACGGSLRKVFSAAGLIFKGSGWHIKDYAGSSRGSAATERAGSDGPTGGASDATSAGAAGTSSTSDTAARPAASTAPSTAPSTPASPAAAPAPATAGA